MDQTSITILSSVIKSLNEIIEYDETLTEYAAENLEAIIIDIQALRSLYR